VSNGENHAVWQVILGLYHRSENTYCKRPRPEIFSIDHFDAGLEAPPSGRVAAKGFPSDGVLAWLQIQNLYLEHIPWLGLFHKNGTGQDMDSIPTASGATKVLVGARHGIPKVNVLHSRISFNNVLVVIACMMGRHLYLDFGTRWDSQHRINHLAEVAPVDIGSTEGQGELGSQGRRDKHR
jgi:hypothetical protein